MTRFSLKSLAAMVIVALLLAIIALPVSAATAVATAASRTGGASVAAAKAEPFAAYTRKRAKKKARRRVRRHKKIHRHKKVARKTVKKTAPVATAAAPSAPPAVAVDESALAETILAGLKAQYPRYLGSATVEFGDAMGYQAVSYYTVGRIVISPAHTAGVQRIVEHEIWHIIDWQDNNAIDWGEAIPPADYASFAN